MPLTDSVVRPVIPKIKRKTMSKILTIIIAAAFSTSVFAAKHMAAEKPAGMSGMSGMSGMAAEKPAGMSGMSGMSGMEAKK